MSDEVIPHAPLSRPSGDADETNKPVPSCGVAVAWHRGGMMVFAVPIGCSLACLPLAAAGVLRSASTANTTPAGKQEEQEEAAEEVGGSSGVKNLGFSFVSYRKHLHVICRDSLNFTFTIMFYCF